MTRAELSDGRQSMLGHYAGFASRLLAFLIDLLILSVTVVSTTWFVRTSMEMLQTEAILIRLANSYQGIDLLVRIIDSSITHSLVSVIFIIFYYLFFWTVTGQTPGKYIMGLRIVTKSGKKLKLRHAIMRYLGYYISAAALGMGFLWVLADDKRRGWHDRLAGTLVIYVWDARPDEKFLVRINEELINRREALKALVRRRKNIKE